ncbi:MAG: hypothetical protein IJR86_05035 [Bacteroidaceae bacterium]|nr:hypothetical protein [Bacteroidaceae bacterium]
MRKLLILLPICAAAFFTSCSSCQRGKEIEERRAALAHHDEEELQEARDALYSADSTATCVEVELVELKKLFVFEKKEEYQSRGFWVLKEQGGDKTQLDFFAEVEEEGQMLLVSIDKKRKWNFYKVAKGQTNFLESAEVKSFIGRELTDEEKQQVQLVYKLSESMRSYNDAVAAQKKNKLKVQFYEKKIGERNSRID